MEWNDLEEEMKKYGEFTNEQLVDVVRQATESEFWSWYRSRIAQSLKTADMTLKTANTNTHDGLIALAKAQAVYQVLSMFLNLPENVLKSAQLSQAQAIWLKNETSE